MGVLASVLTIMVVTHVVALEVWTSLAELLKEDLNTMTDIERTCNELQRIRLGLRYFNTCNATPIFLFKLLCMTISTLGISTLLLVEFKNPLTLVLTAYSSFGATFCYPVTYQKAYQVEKKIRELKIQVLSKAPKREQNLKLLEKQLLAISNMGVYVGSFRTFERESHLLYFDFITGSVVSILLAWR